MLDCYTCIDYREKILWTIWFFYYRVRHTKYEDRIANSANPDQTAPNARSGLGAVVSMLVLQSWVAGSIPCSSSLSDETLNPGPVSMT